MASEKRRGFYNVNPETAGRKVASPTEEKLLFKGSGDATLTVYHFESWKRFLRRGDRPLTEPEIERIEEAATLENFSIGGRVAVEWPEVELAFSMDDFVGERLS